LAIIDFRKDKHITYLCDNISPETEFVDIPSTVRLDVARFNDSNYPVYHQITNNITPLKYPFLIYSDPVN
jgi:hypothetical protein